MKRSENNYPLFYQILGNNLIAGVTNNLVWFALTFWVFIETQSVLATSWIAGIFAVMSMVGGFIFGPIVDRERKKTAMAHSSIISLISYTVGGIIFIGASPDIWMATSPALWVFVITLMIGVVANNLRIIALSTTVTMLFTDNRDKANGLVGATVGISFAITSIISGVIIGWFGMGVAIITAIGGTALCLFHLATFSLPEPEIVHTEKTKEKVDFRGTYLLILTIPGLLGLIIFNTFNNFLGGVFMALMDAYGLSLVSVQTWGTLWGVMSLAMIGGSIIVSRYGVGNRPLRRIIILNLITWGTCLIFPLQASIYLLAGGMFLWLLLMPMVEAAEQTILQGVVPFERQGRVFGFAQSIESMASPVTTFLIGPIAQLVFIPFMTTGAGVALIGDWFGTGVDRGIALVFIAAGVIGCIATVIAWNSRSYRLLSQHYTAVPLPK
jgi:DHA3 family multidrug efflux protein-like MFS transporter